HEMDQADLTSRERKRPDACAPGWSSPCSHVAAREVAHAGDGSANRKAQRPEHEPAKTAEIVTAAEDVRQSLEDDVHRRKAIRHQRWEKTRSRESHPQNGDAEDSAA